MSILSALFQTNAKSFEEVFSAKDITSSEMKAAIGRWFELYFEAEKADTAGETDTCQRLPVLIVTKLCKAMFSEYTAQVQRGDKWMQGCLLSLGRVKRKAVQQMLVGGECLLKPVLAQDGARWVCVRRDCFVPLARDETGRITSVGTLEQTRQGNRFYTLLERRTESAAGLLIENKLYLSDTRDRIGRPVPLDTLDKYAELQAETTLPRVGGIGLVQLRTPLLNCVDGSDDGVSVYAPAVGLIENVNRNEKQLCTEFENGASRIIASADMVTQDKNGRKKLSGDLFIGVDDDPANVGVTVFSPALREQSYLAREQKYLRNCESLIGLKRGILSEVEAADRTATEVTSSEGDYNLTILDFWEVWGAAVREALALCCALRVLYGGALGAGAAFDPEKDVLIDWGDGVLFNRDKTWAEYRQMVADGMLKPELALAWYFDLPHETPQDLTLIRETYLPELERLLDGDA